MSTSLKGSKIGKQKSSSTKNSQQVTTITIQRGGGRTKKYCFYEKGVEEDDKFYWAYGECEHKIATEPNRNISISENEFIAKKLRSKNLPIENNKNNLPLGAKVWLEKIYSNIYDNDEFTLVSEIKTLAVNKVQRVLQRNNDENLDLLNGLLESKDKEKYDEVKKRYGLRNRDDLAFVISVKDFRYIYGDYTPKTKNVKVVVNNKENICKKYPDRHGCRGTLTGNSRPLSSKFNPQRGISSEYGENNYPPGMRPPGAGNGANNYPPGMRPPGAGNGANMPWGPPN